MSLTKKVNALWGCLICKSLKNSVKDKICPFCGAAREQDRFGFCLDDVYYLCQVNTARAFPSVTINRVTAPESTATIKLSETYESLLDGVKEAVKNSSNDSPEDKKLPRVDNVAEKVDRDARLDLYHRVMQEAKDVKYDVLMGQFVPIGASGSSTESNSAKDLKYVQSMLKEKDTMDKVVKNAIMNRSQDLVHEKNINTSDDALKEWKAKVPCALCGAYFPPAQLLGKISNRTILTWLKEHDASIDTKVCKKMSLQAYEMAKICLFCTQFFDENYAEAFEVEKTANDELQNIRSNNIKRAVFISNEDGAIEKLNEKLAIAELKTKKASVGMRPQVVLNEENKGEECSKSQMENRSVEFEKAKEKFRRHKATLARKSTSRRKSASSSTLPAIANQKKQSSVKTSQNSTKGNYTSRSDGNGNKMLHSSSDTIVKKMKRRVKKAATVRNGALPSIASKRSIEETTGDLDSVGDISMGCATDSTAVIRSKKKKSIKKKKEIVNRMTKKEIARLELLKDVAQRKEKEEKRYRSTKHRREKEWSNVRVGDGGEQEDMNIFREKEIKVDRLIEEYEREMVKQHSSSNCVNSTSDPSDRLKMIEEESDDMIIVENDIIKCDSPPLKPTITLEIIQQHKQHLQNMHLKHLETHIDCKSLEHSPTKKSTTKDMLENHKKHVLSIGATKQSAAEPIRKNVIKPTRLINKQRNTIVAGKNAPSPVVSKSHVASRSVERGHRNKMSAPMSMTTSCDEYSDDDDFDMATQVIDEDFDTLPILDNGLQGVDENEESREYGSSGSGRCLTEQDDRNLIGLPNINDEDSKCDVSYNGYDSFIDSLHTQTSSAHTSTIQLLSTSSKKQLSKKSYKKRVARKVRDEGKATHSDDIDEADEEYDFDYEDENPNYADQHTSGIRCSPVSTTNSIPSTPSTGYMKKSERNSVAENIRGIELLKTASRGQLGSECVSRGASRRRRSRLDQYDNTRPSSKVSRPSSRANKSSGSVRRSSQSSRQKLSETSLLTNKSARITDLESSGSISAGVFSPPTSSVRRRKRGGDSVNKLQVLGKDSSDISANHSDFKLDNMTTSSSINLDVDSGHTLKLDHIRKSEDKAVLSSQKSGKVSSISMPTDNLNSNKKLGPVHSNKRIEDKTSPTIKNTTSDTALDRIKQDKILQGLYPQHKDLFSCKASGIDNSPTMLDLRFKSGKQVLKREDSFDRLSKRITQQQSGSRTFLSNIIKSEAVVRGNKKRKNSRVKAF